MNSLKTVLHHAGCILSALLVVLLAGVTLTNAADLAKVAPAAPKEQAPSETKKPEAPKITIPNLITYTTGLSEELIDLNSLLADITPPDKAMEELPGIKDTLKSLNWDEMMQEADNNLDYNRVSDTMLRLNQQRDSLKSIAKPLNKAIKILAEQEAHWNEERDTLQTWVEALKNKDTFPILRNNITELQTSIDATIDIIHARMRDTLAALHEISGLQVKLYNVKVSAGDLLDDLRSQGREQTSPSIFFP